VIERVSKGRADLIKVLSVSIYICLKCQGKTPLDYQYTLLKNEGRESETGLFQRWVPVGR
jgi:hypothetical protein